jgi:hypothetical protein
MAVASGADCCFLLPSIMLAIGPGNVFYQMDVGRCMLLPVLIVVSYYLVDCCLLFFSTCLSPAVIESSHRAMKQTLLLPNEQPMLPPITVVAE